MQDIIIAGAGGLGKEVLFQLREMNKISPQYNILGFVDDNCLRRGAQIHGMPVLGTTDWFVSYDKPVCVAVAIGKPFYRKKIAEKLKANENISFPSLIAHNVIISEHVTVGEGCIICFSNTLTVDIKLGDFVLINNACTVGHDSTIGGFTTLYPGVNVSGNVRIGSGCEIGAGSFIIQGRDVGDNTTVGACAAVIIDLPSDCTAVGVPAKVIKQRSQI